MFSGENTAIDNAKLKILIQEVLVYETVSVKDNVPTSEVMPIHVYIYMYRYCTAMGTIG